MAGAILSVSVPDTTTRSAWRGDAGNGIVLIWKAFEFRAGRKSAKGLNLVSTIITAEPMLGILGTVTGIMQTFGALNGADGAAANPLAATSGIGEALITTAAGLVAALLLLFPYNWLDSKLDED